MKWRLRSVTDVIFKASVQMLATKDYVYAMSSGAVGDLPGSAGMPGDDTVAHSFAAKYEPATQTIISRPRPCRETLGLTASKLLAMATLLRRTTCPATYAMSRNR
jgi:hypothetical protein